MEMKGRKIRTTPAMDAEERHQQKRLGYIKSSMHSKYKVPLAQIKLNRMTKRVSVNGQVVARTCENGSLKYHKYHDIEKEVGVCTNEWLIKKLVPTTVSSRDVGIKRRSEGSTTSSHEEGMMYRDQTTENSKVKAAEDRDSNM